MVNLIGRPVVKTHGLLRVGTNYVQALLNANFSALTLDSSDGGWKHGPCHYDARRKFIFVVKNPYAWLVSFRNWERIHNRSAAESLAEFASQPISHGELKAAWEVNSPVEAWNKAIRSWLSFNDRENVVFIRYVDLIADFAGQLARIRDRLHLKMKVPDFVNIPTRADNWETPNPRQPLEVDAYRSEKYLEEFDEPALALLRRQLDPDLLERFNYRLY